MTKAVQAIKEAKVTLDQLVCIDINRIFLKRERNLQLLLLKGVTGSKGDQGSTGQPGTPGSKGDHGDKGDIGDTGIAGSDGEKVLFTSCATLYSLT